MDDGKENIFSPANLDSPVLKSHHVIMIRLTDYMAYYNFPWIVSFICCSHYLYSGFVMYILLITLTFIWIYIMIVALQKPLGHMQYDEMIDSVDEQCGRFVNNVHLVTIGNVWLILWCTVFQTCYNDMIMMILVMMILIIMITITITKQ